MRKTKLDGLGFGALLGVSLLFAANQVIIKITNAGLQPVFFAGLRSLLAIGFILLWMRWRAIPLRYLAGSWRAGVGIGVVFAVEFLCLFMALDMTTVSRAAIIFYSMPLWLALAAHFGLPNERITPIRALGLVLAFAGTAWAILDHSGRGAQASLTGDLFALGGALGWAATAYMARGSAMARVGPETQLLWMVSVSAVILLIAAPFFGPLIRDLQPVHIIWLLVQASFVVTGGFILWFWLLSVYPAATVASFSFLTPVLGMVLGWAVMGETISASVALAAALVAGGIILINRR